MWDVNIANTRYLSEFTRMHASCLIGPRLASSLAKTFLHARQVTVWYSRECGLIKKSSALFNPNRICSDVLCRVRICA